jgi:hypothetical protein
MKKMIRQIGWAFVGFGGFMLLFGIVLSLGLAGDEVSIRGFYYVISLLFIGLGGIAIRKCDQIR